MPMIAALELEYAHERLILLNLPAIEEMFTIVGDLDLSIYLIDSFIIWKQELTLI